MEVTATDERQSTAKSKTADPSTSLRFAQDDTFFWGSKKAQRAVLGILQNPP
jgi:hypothetical protein